jgi:hypothetical protein
MQVSVGQAGHVKIKLGDGLVPVSGRKINVMMNFLKLTSCWFAPAMKPNGPAIKGGCVTWRSIRAVSWCFRQETVPVQARYGTCFCCHGRRFIGCRHGRGTIYISGRVIVPVTNVRKRQWRSVAV